MENKQPKLFYFGSVESANVQGTTSQKVVSVFNWKNHFFLSCILHLGVGLLQVQKDNIMTQAEEEVKITIPRA